MPAVSMSYREVADDLAARIRAGEYPPGSRLPSYAQLATLYSVSVSTISRAVGLLRYQELVAGVQGVGLFVADQGD